MSSTKSPTTTPVDTDAASSSHQHARNNFTTGMLLAIGGAVLFSAKAIFVKLSYRYGIDAVTLIALRMAFSVPVFAGVLWWVSRGAAPLSRGDHARLWLIGFLGYYAASFLDFLGLQYISAAFERLILYLTPTIVLFLSAVFLRKPITRLDLIALALSYGGIVLVFWHDVSLAGANVPLGALLVFGSAVCYASYLVLSGELVQRVGALRLTAYAMCVATTFCSAQFVLVNPWSALQQPMPVLWLAVANALFSTVIPVFATMLAVSRIGAANVSMASMVGPVAMIGLGYVVLDEPVTGWQIAGTSLVLAGVFVLTRKGAKSAASKTNTATTTATD